MNKSDLAKKVGTKTKLTQKESLAAINAIMGLITDALKRGDDVTLTGFGKFEVRNRKKRYATNPQTGQKIMIPATRVPAFKVGKSLKKKILA